MKGSRWLTFVLLSFCLAIWSCEEDSPEPVEMPLPDTYILFRGQITDARSGDPIPDLTIYAFVGGRVSIFWTIKTDSNGNYLIDVPDIQKYMREHGYNETDIFNFFSQEDIDVSFDIVPDNCEWISIDPNIALREYFTDNELPINFQKDFVLTSSQEFQFMLVDTVGREEGPTGWNAELQFRVLSETAAYANSMYYDMEYFPLLRHNTCFPFNQAVEVKARFSEFIRDANETPLGTKTILDTLELTGEEIRQYVISW